MGGWKLRQRSGRDGKKEVKNGSGEEERTAGRDGKIEVRELKTRGEKKEGRRMWNEEITVTYHTIDKLDMSSLHITTQKSNDRKDSLFISASYWIYF